MPSPRSVPLIERRADARELAEKVRAHKKECGHCSSWAVRGTCAEEKRMRADLKAIREEIAHWFDPPPGAETLFR